MKIGFIGIGNMAQAIINGMSDKNSIIISARTLEDTKFKAERLGVHAASSHKDCVINSDIIILSVKPEVMEAVICDIKDSITNKTLVSIAAKLSLDTLTAWSGTHAFARVMPNLNVAIKKGTSAIVFDRDVPETHKEVINSIFNNIGDITHIEEAQMSGFIGLAGSLPAFVFKFINAVADACIEEGYTKEQAIEIAASAVSGSAQYLKSSHIDPEILTQRVCSPGGTTIEGVRELDTLDFENTIQKSIRKVIDKDKRGL